MSENLKESKTCTCGRNLGMSNDEKIHHALDKIFGKSEYVPKTQEQLDAERKEYEENQLYELNKKKEYLIKNNVKIPELESDIISTHEKHVYDIMTDNERKEKMRTITNYNVIRILFGISPLAYQ